MAEKRKLNGVWDANRVLQEYLHFADKRGRIKKIDLSDDSPYGIKHRRFVAVMKAYGRDMGNFNEFEGIISKSCSPDKLDEFRQLLNPLLDNDYYKELINDARLTKEVVIYITCLKLSLNTESVFMKSRMCGQD